MVIIKTFLVPRNVEMTGGLMDHSWDPEALMIPSAALSLNLSQNAATHWTTSVWIYSVDSILTTVLFSVNNVIAPVSFLYLLSDWA